MEIIKHMHTFKIEGKLLYIKLDDIKQTVYDAVKN